MTSHSTPATTPGTSLMRARWAAIGAAVVVAVGGGGLMTANAVGESTRPAAVFVATTPCRLIDTREAPETVGPRSTPLGENETYTAAATGTNGRCTIPADAATLVMNVTVTDQSASSYLTVFEAGSTRPLASSLNWEAAVGAVGNAVTANVSTGGELSFYNQQGSAQLVVDVVGYYTNAPLAGFYTKAEIDALIAGQEGVGPVGPKGEAGDTGDSVLDGLTCNIGETITWNGSAWECHQGTTTTVIANLRRNGWEPIGPQVQDTFPIYTDNLIPTLTSACDGTRCEIHIGDVPDERTCDVNFLGTNMPPYYETDQAGIFIYDLSSFYGHPFEVAISCTW